MLLFVAEFSRTRIACISITRCRPQSLQSSWSIGASLVPQRPRWTPAAPRTRNGTRSLRLTPVTTRARAHGTRSTRRSFPNWSTPSSLRPRLVRGKELPTRIAHLCAAVRAAWASHASPVQPLVRCSPWRRHRLPMQPCRSMPLSSIRVRSAKLVSVHR